MTEENFRTDILPLKHRIYAYALSMTFDREKARDIVQEVFEKLWRNREKLHTVDNLEAWTIRICRNHILDKMKQKVPSIHSIDGAEVIQIAERSRDRLEEKDLIEKVKKIIEYLPEKQREIFRLRELQGFNNYEIQEILGLSDNQVKVNLFRARKKIKELLLQKINYGLQA